VAFELPELQRRNDIVMKVSWGCLPTMPVLTDDQLVADYFEAVSLTGANPKQAANWIMGDIAAYLNTKKLSITSISLKPTILAELLTLIEDGTIGKIAKDILPELLTKGGSAKELVERKGLIQISDTGALAAIIDSVVAANPKG